MTPQGLKLSRMHGRLMDRQGNPGFEYAGKEGVFYACVANTFSRTTAVGIGGEDLMVDLVLFALKTEFFVTSDIAEDPYTSGDRLTSDDRPYPVTGMVIAFCSRSFLIERVHDPLPNDPGTVLELACVSVSK